MRDMESPESSDIRIEKARPEDARGMQEVFYRAWLATYPNAEHNITKEDIEEKFKDRLSDEVLVKRGERLGNPVEGETTLVAREGAKVVGLCRVVVHDDRNEQAAFYLLPEYQRKGIGTRLWHEAQKYTDPSKPSYVHVVAYNTPAIEFYKSLGYVDTGKRFTDERTRMKNGAQMPEMEMVLEGKYS